eukprot:NODE_86_length_22075_cov_1.190253.p13 type:complete len:253 gc:universal NODE_86_length_22075_cov_1.190253:3541-4299(+)
MSTNNLIIRNETFVAIETILEAYFHVSLKIVDERDNLSELDLQMIIQNSLFVHNLIVDDVIKDLNELSEFYSNFSEAIIKRAEEGKEKLILGSFNKYCPHLVSQIYKFTDMNLSDDNPLSSTQLPSHNMGNIIFKFKAFGRSLATYQNEIIGRLISVFLIELSKDTYWTASGKLRNLGVGGVELIMLDVQFLLRSFEEILNENIKQEGKKLLEKAIKSYFEKCGETGKQPKQFKTTDWFEKQVQHAISDIPK